MSISRPLAVAGVLVVALLVPGPGAAAQVSSATGPTTSAAAVAVHAKSFTMPSGNIACLYDSARLRCDIFSGLVPEPKKPCEFFWKGVLLPAAGRASWLCIIDTIYDPDAPTLHYGQKWTRHGIVCRSRTTGLRCHNPDGHGFRLSRAHSSKW
jgi:hypothetical protein